MLLGDVLSWLLATFESCYDFTQDNAPTNMANLIQNWCKKHFLGFLDKSIWLSSRPDINPTDDTIWPILESYVSHKILRSERSFYDVVVQFDQRGDDKVVHFS